MSFTDKQINALVHILCDMSHAIYDSSYADNIRRTIMANSNAFYELCTELQRTYTEEGYINEDETINVLIAYDSPSADDVLYWNARVLTEVMEQCLQYSVVIKYEQVGNTPLTGGQICAILDERFKQVITIQQVSFTLNEKSNTATYCVEGCTTLPSLEKSIKQHIDCFIKSFTCIDTSLRFNATVYDGWYEEDNTLYDLEQHLLKERADIRTHMNRSTLDSFLKTSML